MSLSTHALGTSERAGSASPGPSGAASTEPLALRAIRNLDLALLALALPIFVLADFPLLGYAVGAAAWLIQRAIRAALERRARASEDLRTVTGLLAGSMLARGWLVALAIFAVGLAERESGLAAAVLFVVVFTAYLSMQVALRPFDAPARSAGADGAGPPSGGAPR